MPPAVLVLQVDRKAHPMSIGTKSGSGDEERSPLRMAEKYIQSTIVKELDNTLTLVHIDVGTRSNKSDIQM